MESEKNEKIHEILETKSIILESEENEKIHEIHKTKNIKESKEHDKIKDIRETSWNNCVRRGALALGFGMLAGGVGSFFLASETPVMIGAGLGVSVAMKHCRSQIKKVEEALRIEERKGEPKKFTEDIDEEDFCTCQKEEYDKKSRSEHTEVQKHSSNTQTENFKYSKEQKTPQNKESKRPLHFCDEKQYVVPQQPFKADAEKKSQYKEIQEFNKHTEVQKPSSSNIKKSRTQETEVPSIECEEHSDYTGLEKYAQPKEEHPLMFKQQGETNELTCTCNSDEKIHVNIDEPETEVLDINLKKAELEEIYEEIEPQCSCNESE